jgi:hypothetical protein
MTLIVTVIAIAVAVCGCRTGGGVTPELGSSRSAGDVPQETIVELVTVFGNVFNGEIHWHPDLDAYIVQEGGVRQTIRRDQVRSVTLDVPRSTGERRVEKR